MPFVNSGDDEDARSNRATAGGPPTYDDVEFDPSDPDVVKVHYDVSAWDFEQRAELSETLAERSVPHVWLGDEVVVPEAIEAGVDAIFDELERELGPFPVALAGDDDGTEFGLDEWPSADLELLRSALAEAEIPHRWSGTMLVVAADAEHAVDELLDAIEAGDVASMDEAAPDGILNDLYRAADRLRRQPTTTDARETILDRVPSLSPSAPPFGLAVVSWRSILDRANALSDVFTGGNADADSITRAANDLRNAIRPWV